MPSPFRFLVLEGCNGVGKSTLAEYLCARTGALSFHYPPEFVSFRRDVRLDQNLTPVPRLAYYLAATLHLADLVRAQLPKSHVICDRYLASPLSLMIGEASIAEEKARELAEPFEAYLRSPDLILLVTAAHAVASARIEGRSVKSGILTPIAQRTRESLEFFQTREDACRRMSQRLGAMVELNTTNLSIEEMCASAWSLVSSRLEW